MGKTKKQHKNLGEHNDYEFEKNTDEYTGSKNRQITKKTGAY